MTLRSLLYVPADNDEFIAKAHLRGADAIILDLEDSVLNANKPNARQNLATSVKLCKQSGATVFVRINAARKMRESDASAALQAGADGVYLPKARAKRIGKLHRFLKPLEKSLNLKQLAIIALIEDAKGVLQAEKIARHSRVIALTIGAEDLANAIGATPDPDVLRFPKQLVHFTAKAHGIMSFGLFRSVVDYSNIPAIQAAAEEARKYGFDGASCIHPAAVPILNAAFSASKEEQIWAREVLQAAQDAQAGSFTFRGQMVDAPVLARAKRILNKP